jgi:hypothetical protein
VPGASIVQPAPRAPLGVVIEPVELSPVAPPLAGLAPEGAEPKRVAAARPSEVTTITGPFRRFETAASKKPPRDAHPGPNLVENREFPLAGWVGLFSVPASRCVVMPFGGSLPVGFVSRGELAESICVVRW